MLSKCTVTGIWMLLIHNKAPKILSHDSFFTLSGKEKPLKSITNVQAELYSNFQRSCRWPRLRSSTHHLTWQLSQPCLHPSHSPATALSSWLNLSGPQFTHLWNSDNNSTHLTGAGKSLGQYLANNKSSSYMSLPFLHDFVDSSSFCRQTVNMIYSFWNMSMSSVIFPCFQTG